MDPFTGDQREVPEAWSDRKAKKFAKEYGLNMMSKTKKKVGTVTLTKSFYMMTFPRTQILPLSRFLLTSGAVDLLGW